MFLCILVIVLMFASIDSPVAGIFLGILLLLSAYRAQKDIYNKRDALKMVILGYPFGIFYVIYGIYRLSEH